MQYFMTPGSFRHSQDRVLDTKPGMTVALCVLRPESIGTIHAKSPDPFAPPAIRPNFLASQVDCDAVVEGARIARRIVEAPPLDPYRGPELEPGAEARTDDELLDFARDTGTTVYHPVGTCKMGSDPDGRGGRSAPGPRARTPPGGGCFHHAHPRLRQHQRTGHHDRGEGGGPHPRGRGYRRLKQSAAGEIRAGRRASSRPGGRGSTWRSHRLRSRGRARDRCRVGCMAGFARTRVVAYWRCALPGLR